MPIYQYRCLNCKKRFEVYLSYKEYGEKSIHCPQCKSDQVQRRIERIRIAKSEESRLDSLTDISGLEGIENDPRSLGKMMRKMGNEMGEEVGPEFDEVVDRLEAGQSPEDIEKAIPDLEGGAGGSGEDMDF
ncbi:MAG: zinc ribbon domain-containing protein [Anaerolineales bacterium]